MNDFWSAIGLLMVASVLAPLARAQEEHDEMGRNRRKNKRNRKRREQAKQNRAKGKQKKNHPKHVYATLFYTAGVKDELGSLGLSDIGDSTDR